MTREDFARLLAAHDERTYQPDRKRTMQARELTLTRKQQRRAKRARLEA